MYVCISESSQLEGSYVGDLLHTHTMLASQGQSSDVLDCDWDSPDWHLTSDYEARKKHLTCAKPYGDFSGDSVVKNPPPSAGDTGDVGSIHSLGRSPGEGSEPSAVFLPGKSCGQSSLAIVQGVTGESDTTWRLSNNNKPYWTLWNGNVNFFTTMIIYLRKNTSQKKDNKMWLVFEELYGLSIIALLVPCHSYTFTGFFFMHTECYHDS